VQDKGRVTRSVSFTIMDLFFTNNKRQEKMRKRKKEYDWKYIMKFDTKWSHLSGELFDTHAAHSSRSNYPTDTHP
jgi:hypothetical protein